MPFREKCIIMFRNFWRLYFYKCNIFQSKIHFCFYGNMPDERNGTVRFLFHRDVLILNTIAVTLCSFKRQISGLMTVIAVFLLVKNV